MKFLDLILPTPAENLACDEVLIDLCEENQGSEVLRFWESTVPFVVLGYANQAEREVNLAACRAAGIEVFRRCSGGGTVLQIPGCLNYSLVLRIPDSGPMQGISGANKCILERNRAALEALVKSPVHIRGQTDLAVGDLKFSGNSQRRKKKYLLFHGTFLLKVDLALIEQFLRTPSKEPDYRQNRAHREFLTNLNLPPDQVKQALRRAWDASEAFSEAPVRKIEALAREKYSTAEWNFRF